MKVEVLLSPLLLLTLLTVPAHSQIVPPLSHDIYVDSHGGVSNETCWEGGEGLPCSTLGLALRGVMHFNHTATVWVAQGVYYLNTTNSTTNVTAGLSFQFTYMTNLAIVGLASNPNSTGNGDPPVSVYCTRNSGLSFYRSRNVTLRGVLFNGCRVLHESTSQNFNTDSNKFSFVHFYTALYFLYCQDISLVNIAVTNSLGVGTVVYNTAGHNVIQNSTFFRNVAGKEDGHPGGGGLYIEFSYCTPGMPANDINCTGGSNVPLEFSSNATYKILSCQFIENKANITDPARFTFILPQLSNHLAFGRGGGVSVFFKGNAHNNTIFIDNSTFFRNEAIWGAGIFVEYQDNSLGNVFEVRNSTLKENQCFNLASPTKGTGGGGARIGFIFYGRTHAQDNAMIFDTVKFVANKAYYGGGLSFYSSREPTSANATNSLEFVNCTWSSNIARVGSGADLSVWHPVPMGAIVKPSFTNCSFLNNNGSYDINSTYSSSVVGIGALYIDSIPIEFYEHVLFDGNNSTALASVSTGIYFGERCIARFSNNFGRNGGAMALMGYAFIQVSDSTVVLFVNNTAEISGGAIYGQSIGEHDLISSRNCFVRYHDISAMPTNWTVLFFFSNNRANNKSNSIYATSLLTCMWGSAFGTTEQDAEDVFCWNSNGTKWNYDNSDCQDEITTSPAVFNRTDATHFSALYWAVPGKRSELPLVMHDDRGRDVTSEAILTARSLTPGLVVDKTSLFIADNKLELHATPNTSGRVILETADPRVISIQLNISVRPCPPGMVRVGSGIETDCTCRGEFTGLVQCNPSNYSAKLQRGAWMGYYYGENEHGIFAGVCPYCSQISNESFFLMPPFAYQLNDSLCGSINREGLLCGKCVDGYGPVVNSDEFLCIKCTEAETKYHWVFYLMTEFLPITVFFFIVVLFNVSVTSGPANAFVLFAQMLTTAINIDGDGAIQLKTITPAANILKHIYVIPYDIWNLNFFRPILPKFCLSPDLTTFQLISTGYVTALYPLILVGIFYSIVSLYSHDVGFVLCIFRPVHRFFLKFRRIWDLQRSIMHALATFILLSYSKFTLVSFILLTSAVILDDQGRIQGKVVYYDGTIEFLSKEHIPYVIVSIIVLLTFVGIPPILLVAPSIFRYLQRLPFCGCLAYLQPGARLQQFLSAFQGCYKDGTGEGENKHDFRWFAGFYFLLRLIMLLVFAFTPDWFMQFVVQQLLFMGASIFVIIFRPYKNDFFNKVDAVIFGFLAAIGTLTMYNYYRTLIHVDLSVTAFSLQYVLVFCPLIYMIVYVSHHIVSVYGTRIAAFFSQYCCRKCVKNPDNDNEEFLRFAEEAGRLGVQDAPDELTGLINNTPGNSPNPGSRRQGSSNPRSSNSNSGGSNIQEVINSDSSNHAAGLDDEGHVHVKLSSRVRHTFPQ